MLTFFHRITYAVSASTASVVLNQAHLTDKCPLH